MVQYDLLFFPATTTTRIQPLKQDLQIDSVAIHLENPRRLWLSEIHCWKGFPANLTLLENSSPIFRQHEELSLPRFGAAGNFGHFPARDMAAGKSAPPSGMLLDFLLRDRHSLLELFGCTDHPFCRMRRGFTVEHTLQMRHA